mmetsp:Transcript_7422/g.6657  ORF Transcript_7422/g.6657 Transcript_7422/m.6657 type:complete len:81 (+) Transcript_7422:94-336(+)
MGIGDIKHMSMHEFVWFVAIIIAIGIIGAYVLNKLWYQITMSTDEYRRKLHTQDMIELQAMLREREYDEIAGRILLPRAC